MDPIVDDDEETNAAKARITEIIESLNKDSIKNENVQFHDFRMVKGSTHSNLILMWFCHMDIKCQKNR